MTKPEFIKTSQNDLVLWCEFNVIILLQVMRAGFEVYNINIVLFLSTYMTSVAVPVPLVLIPKYTTGCKASDSYS